MDEIFNKFDAYLKLTKEQQDQAISEYQRKQAKHNRKVFNKCLKWVLGSVFFGVFLIIYRFIMDFLIIGKYDISEFEDLINFLNSSLFIFLANIPILMLVLFILDTLF